MRWRSTESAPHAGGRSASFGLYSYPCVLGDTSESSFNFNVWAAVRGNGDILFPAGDSSYDTLLITESRDYCQPWTVYAHLAAQYRAESDPIRKIDASFVH